MAIRRYRRRAPVRRRVYSRRRTRTRTPYRRTRFRRRRTRSMKGKWSTPDRFRMTAPYDMLDPSFGTTEIAHDVVFSHKSAYCSWAINPAYISDALGAHGKYDSQLVGVSGEAITLATRTFEYERNNRGLAYVLRRPKFTFRLTPDWREQGNPDSDTSYAANAGMVVEAYLLTTRKPFLKTDALFGTGSELILQDLNFTPFDDATTPSDGGSGITGWPKAYANGVERRIGYVTKWSSATTIDGFTSAGYRRRATISQLCSDGISILDSPEIHAKYRVRRVARKFITPGTSATIKCTMPSQYYDTRRLDQTLPVSSTAVTNWTGYFPRNYGTIILRYQMLSNRADATTHPPVSFKSEVSLTAQLLVKDSNYGGNLYLDLQKIGLEGDPAEYVKVDDGPMDGSFLQPANPLRAGGEKP